MEQPNQERLKELSDVVTSITEAYEEAKTKSNQLYKDLQEAKKAYDSEFYKGKNCDSCRYSIVLEFSFDGWHNLCGHENAPCTCCNRRCAHFKPHNCITKWISDHNINLDGEYVKALDLLYMDIFSTDSLDLSENTCFEKIIDTIKIKKGIKDE